MVSTVQLCAYMLGHFYNDMVSTVWFTYFLLYVTIVLQMPRKEAAVLLIVGKIMEALSTLIPGVFVDKYKICNCYPKRKTWHLIGTVMRVLRFKFDCAGLRCMCAAVFVQNHKLSLMYCYGQGQQLFLVPCNR